MVNETKSSYVQEDAEKHFDAMVTPAPLKDETKNEKKKFFLKRWSRKKLLIVLAIVLAVLLAIILIGLFVVGKALAQKYANSLNVSMQSMDMNTFNPDQKSIQVATSIEVTHTSPFNAEVDATTTDLMYNGKKLGQMGLPAQTLKSDAKKFMLNWDSTLLVTDQEVMNQMSTDLINSKSIKLDVTGEVTIRTIGMTYNGINLKLSMDVKGMNKFTDPVSTLDKIEASYCQGNRVYITNFLTVNNNGQIGMNGAGVLNTSVYYEDAYIGYAISMDAAKSMPRGESKQQFNLTIDITNSTKITLNKMATAITAKETVNYYIKGNNPQNTKLTVLKEGLNAVNMHLQYVKGLTDEMLHSASQQACLFKFFL